MSDTFLGKNIAMTLPKKGFQKGNSKHHKYFWLHVDGKKTAIKTYISHGKIEYGDALQSQMAKQLKITKSQLQELLKCNINHEEYVSILNDNNHL